MAKTQKNFRMSGLTASQMAELAEHLDLSDTEIVTLAIDRLYRDLLATDPGIMSSIAHFTRKIHALEETPVDEWAWHGADLENLECILMSLSKQ